MSLVLILAFYLFDFTLISADGTPPWYEIRHESHTNDWVELRFMNGVKSVPLSTNYLSSARRNLNFKFPFYGEPVDEVAVTSQGFMYMGAFHQSMYETMYVAPLMANFRPSDVNPSHDIRTYQSNKKFITQWSTMLLDEQRSSGFFTFQLQLHSTGIIKFLYLESALPIADISSENHLVKVGISDAYAEQDRYTGTTWIPYDFTDLDLSKVKPNTTYTLVPLKGCRDLTSCSDCTSFSADCSWCTTEKRCSNGLDKYFTEWHDSGCANTAVTECEAPPTPPAVFPTTKPPILPTDKVPEPTVKREDPPDNVVEKPPPTPPHNKVPNETDNEPHEKAKQKTTGQNTGMTVIVPLLISTGIATIIVISALLIKKFGWKRKAHTQFSVNGANNDGSHTLLKDGKVVDTC